MGVVHYFVHTTAFLERNILGLRYEIRGQENLPSNGEYIIASKHQSAYETTKLHILFKDPAIVLKRELLNIPLWGWYLKKSDQIAINRSTPKKAIESIKKEAKRVALQGRPIVIFPQGTRVSPVTTSEKRPYKVGVVRVQEATQRPIIPMALNTGTFYPRNAWIKKPGTVIFEFLEPIKFEKGKEPNEILKTLESGIEEKSNQLREEALNEVPNKTRASLITILATVIVLFIWTINWIIAANLTETAIHQSINNLKSHPAFVKAEFGKIKITGFPLKIKASLNYADLETNLGKINIKLIDAKSWPFLGMPINITAHKAELRQYNWTAPLEFRDFKAIIKHTKPKLDILYAKVMHENAEAQVSGFLIEPQINKHADVNLNITIQNHEDFLAALERVKAVNRNVRMLTTIALNALEKDGIVKTNITSQESKLYLGLIKIYEFPKASYAGMSRKADNKPKRRRPAHLIENREKSVYDRYQADPNSKEDANRFR